VAQSNGVVLSGRMVEKAEEQVIERLKENKKIILILDLDNTILHCMETSIYDTTVPINIPDSFYIIYMETLLVIKMRKYLR
jgi:TFIIF-interacting CTD phosphatase-like protein